MKQGWGHEENQARMINSAQNVNGKFWLWHPAVSWKYKSEKIKRNEVRDPSLKSGATKVDELTGETNCTEIKKVKDCAPENMEHGHWRGECYKERTITTVKWGPWQNHMMAGNRGRKIFQEAERGHQLRMLHRDEWQREKDMANKEEGHLWPQ